MPAQLSPPNFRLVIVGVVVDAGVVVAAADDCVGVGVVLVGRTGAIVVHLLGSVLFLSLRIANENTQVVVVAAVGSGRRVTMMNRGDLMPRRLHGNYITDSSQKSR